MAMRYVSTRGQCEPVGFEDALLAGLAPDGGLYLPEAWPTLEPATWSALRGESYQEVARAVLTPFVEGVLRDDELRETIAQAYASFNHRQVAPLVQLGPDLWLMELYHGPTLAFKDVAMQVLARWYDVILTRLDRRVTIVGATSGDTGGAAIEAFRGRDRAGICILHPKGRTSDVQRKQMTTVAEDNVLNLAVEGTFDDCQTLVKSMFRDEGFRDTIRMTGVNSINWARLAPQAVYYATAAFALGGPDRPVSFSVPTGNFGDVFAGYVAKQMGVRMDRLIVASNRNDILTRALGRGDHSLHAVHPTMSPSMDIQISSNLERLLFDLSGRDAGWMRNKMQALQTDRRFELEPEVVDRAAQHFDAASVDEDETLATIREVHDQHGLVIDPHTAVGVAAAKRYPGEKGVPMVVLGTAHPAKFPDAVERAVNHRPVLPEHLSDLYEREERFDTVPNELADVQAAIAARFAG